MLARFTSKDEELVRLATDWYLLTPSEFSRLTRRNVVAIRERLQTLGCGRRKDGDEYTEGLKFLYATDPPNERWGERIWYPSQKAFDLALQNGWVSESVSADPRKDGKLAHDRLVVRYRWMLHARFDDRLHWSQHRYNIYDRWDTQADDHILADAFFYLQRPNGTYPSFFVEVEKTNEAKYDARGFSSRIRKAEAYIAYFERGRFQEKFRYPDFRVIFLLPTARKAENLAAKFHQVGGTLDARRFWITDFDSAFSGEPKIYMTPVDLETRRHSLDET